MKRIALVHDFLNQLGGAERVLETIHDIFPQAPVYTLLYDRGKTRNTFDGWKIQASFLQNWSNFLRQRHRYLLPFLPSAIESFNFSNFDAVISDSNSFAKGVITPPGVTHVCYCHSPTRYLWDWYHQYLAENKLKGLKGNLTRLILHFLRLWDQSAAERVDYFIANSKTTQERIKKYYQAKSVVIYPPVETERFKISKKPADYFLIVSRLSPYKNIALAVKTFGQLKLPLLIIGEGSQKEELEKIITSQKIKKVKLLGWQNDERMIKYYENCRALIFPGEEDFGIVPVEAMAAGRPVIALGRGGATETVVDGKSGILFPRPEVQSLTDAVKKFQKIENNFNPQAIRKHAQKFDKTVFQAKIKEFIRAH